MNDTIRQELLLAPKEAEVFSLYDVSCLVLHFDVLDTSWGMEMIFSQCIELFLSMRGNKLHFHKL